MLEKQRHQYLSALGIDQYVPKRSLSAAKPPSLLADEYLMDPSEPLLVSIDSKLSALEATAEYHSGAIAASRHTMAVEPATKAAPAPLLKDELQTLSRETANTEKAEVVEPSTRLPSPIQFVLNVWRVAEDCLVLDSRQPGAALPTDRLLQNILRAIGYPLAQLPTSETIRWPLFTNNYVKKHKLSQDESQARAMVQAFINAQHTKAPIAKLILMGEAAARFALDSNQTHENMEDELTEQFVRHQQWGAWVAVTPSLVAMLQEPMLKAKAWKVLQQFLSS